MLFLKNNLSLVSFLKTFIWRLRTVQHEFFSAQESHYYNMFTHLLWEFVLKNDTQKILKKLEEPCFGNPPKIYREKKIISQDLANSVLEYYAIMDTRVHQEKIRTMMELGAGYGRTAFVFLKLHPGIRYYVVDIPPALYVSQTYLRHNFQSVKSFHIGLSENYAEVKEEMDQCDLLFFLPHQMQLLPSQSIDLFINISALHEMRKEQIAYYFTQIERLTSHYFYFKQWKISRIPYEEIEIREGEYPIPKQWRQILSS